MMRRLCTTDAGFEAELAQLTYWEDTAGDEVETVVADIIRAVRSRGDEALLDYTRSLDRRAVGSAAELQLSPARLQQALADIDDASREALQQAAQRIEDFHQRQRQASWDFTDALGNTLGQRVTALQRVGIYVPGGLASYPSSVLMNAIPARVAGVEEVVMVVPAPDDQLNDMVLAAAAIAGVQRVFTIGGAQAVAALAFGTDSVPAVDKIVGPGNRYVAAAKRRVFGRVGIDMVAGPSEILIISDGSTDPDWLAMDLFSQAEHDASAQSILISPDAAHVDAVAESIQRLLPEMERADIIRASLKGRGAFIVTRDLAEAVAVSNRIAPEHLELSVAEPELLLPAVQHAGAIFLGRWTTETLGDYCAGPNHVLPTAGTARFFSPLGVPDFQKRTSVIHCSPAGAAALGDVASVLARGESLTAHARSAELRAVAYRKQAD